MYDGSLWLIFLLKTKMFSPPLIPIPLTKTIQLLLALLRRLLRSLLKTVFQICSGNSAQIFSANSTSFLFNLMDNVHAFIILVLLNMIVVYICWCKWPSKTWNLLTELCVKSQHSFDVGFINKVWSSCSICPHRDSKFTSIAIPREPSKICYSAWNQHKIDWTLSIRGLNILQIFPVRQTQRPLWDSNSTTGIPHCLCACCTQIHFNYIFCMHFLHTYGISLMFVGIILIYTFILLNYNLQKVLN